MIDIHGIIERATVAKKDNKEFWSFRIKDEDEKIISLDSFVRHFTDPILSEESFTIVSFENDDKGELIEVIIPRREVPASLSDIEVFEGKSVVIKKTNDTL